MSDRFIRFFGEMGNRVALTLSHEVGVVEGEEFRLEVFVVSREHSTIR